MCVQPFEVFASPLYSIKILNSNQTKLSKVRHLKQPSLISFSFMLDAAKQMWQWAVDRWERTVWRRRSEIMLRDLRQLQEELCRHLSWKSDGGPTFSTTSAHFAILLVLWKFQFHLKQAFLSTVESWWYESHRVHSYPPKCFVLACEAVHWLLLHCRCCSGGGCYDVRLFRVPHVISRCSKSQITREHFCFG